MGTVPPGSYRCFGASLPQLIEIRASGALDRLLSGAEGSRSRPTGRCEAKLAEWFMGEPAGLRANGAFAAGLFRDEKADHGLALKLASATGVRGAPRPAPLPP